MRIGCRVCFLGYAVLLAVNATADENADGRGAAAVDYMKLARSLVRYPHNPVIKVGQKGQWDDQTLGCFAVVDNGTEFYFYSEGAQFGQAKTIGMAVSQDGIAWTQHEQNPLFSGSMPHAIKVGDSFALPTEAQWEYACRAGSSTEFHFGDDESQLGNYAWFHGNMNWVGQPGFQGKLFYHDVGAKKPNAFGLYDMHGGVWEWCADWYDENYYFDSPLVDPTGRDTGRFRVLRGGSWFRYGKYARSAYRKVFHPDGDGDATTAYINDFGCRVVINLPAADTERP